MNKQIERRLHNEAEKRYPYELKDGLYGKPERVGMYNENEIFRKGAEWMKKEMINEACEWFSEHIIDYANYDEMDGWNIHHSEMHEDFRKAMEE